MFLGTHNQISNATISKLTVKISFTNFYRLELLKVI